MARRDDIDNYLAQYLAVDRFKDYGPNGLQVEGRAEVHKVVTGVTASRALIELAAERGADLLLVHHGLFWRGQDGRLTGWLKQRVQRLMAHDLNLLAYHLPLDAHPEVGNNVQWARRLGWVVQGRFGEQEMGWLGQLPGANAGQSLEEVRALVAAALGRDPLALCGDGRPIRRVAWCSGGAQGYFEAAVAAGADLYLSGEVSEPQMHLAAETGVAYMACGHHATERYGVQALGEHLADRFGVHHEFIDLPNPA
ncbi:Nif3-like dinuclear metal center hexameric protein [Ideonella livida]|uniref:Nif3-like dinuclear metal center hexameric protein n=1 Tax=Ideonella livida TaxID=2707176 RepID=A0A7C9PED8_9BURK|nr:Nif3-like dinuclear metal center hexameric protein [Ideonella livida]NDY89655.1 Nif3-like dinuclear metal center hexameric protein [Ideonella livida]